MSGNHPRRRRSDDLSESQLLPQRPKSARQSLEEQERSQPTSSTSSPPATPSPDTGPEGNPDLPLSMSTSTLLTANLPTDARTALATVAATLDPPSHKITVRFQGVGDAPPLKVKVAKVSASNTFATVVKFLRKKLYGPAADDGSGGKEGTRQESLFCYVNSVFAPGLDEGVGNLFRCFKVNDELIVAYSRTPAFG